MRIRTFCGAWPIVPHTSLIAVLIGICAMAILALPPIDEPESARPASSSLNQWGSITLFHGLPSNRARAIVQDNDGVLWFGTDGGVARYDGRRIQKVVADGLPNGRIRVLKLDPSGRLWLGADGGAAVLVNGQWRLIKGTDSQATNDIAFASPRLAQSLAPKGQADPKGVVAILAGDLGSLLACSVTPTRDIAVWPIAPADSPLLRLSADNSPLPISSLAVINDRLII